MSTKPSPFFFTDIEQATLRLTGSVILFDNEPHYVYEIREASDGIPTAKMFKCPVNVSNLTASALIQKKLSDPGFGKFRPISPGFVNFFEGCPFTGRVSYHASFLDRVPVRRTKQGLSRENTQVLNPKDSMDFRGLLSSQSFCDMVANKYPEYGDAVEALVTDSSIAVSRRFAVGLLGTGQPTLFKQDEQVGMFRGKDEVLLYPKFKYLREEIIETDNLPNNVNPF